MWEHAFFAKPLPPTTQVPAISRDELLRKAVKPPFVPRLSGPLDTRYFVEADGSDDEEGAEDAPVGRRLQYLAIVQPGGETCSATLSSTASGSRAAARSEAALRMAPGAAELSSYSKRACSVDELLGAAG